MKQLDFLSPLRFSFREPATVYEEIVNRLISKDMKAAEARALLATLAQAAGEKTSAKPGMRGCASCGAHGPCVTHCACQKCIDPDGYEQWRTEYPDQYQAWLDRQELRPGEACDCPSCVG